MSRKLKIFKRFAAPAGPPQYGSQIIKHDGVPWRKLERALDGMDGRNEISLAREQQAKAVLQFAAAGMLLFPFAYLVNR